MACIKCLQNALHSSVRQVELLCLVTASACCNGIDDKKKTSGKILYDMYYFFLSGIFRQSEISVIYLCLSECL